MSSRNSAIAWVAWMLMQPAFICAAQVSLTTLNAPNNEDFNTLALSGIGTAMPPGWVFLESGTNADARYTAGFGTSVTGNTFSFGMNANPDRALGGVRSSVLIPLLGGSFINNTGVVITTLQVTYVGEQWRLGATGRPDMLNFEYSLDATSLNSGTWTNCDSLDFIAPRTTAPTGAVNGNDPANRSILSHTLKGLSILPGAVFWFRWTDFDAAGQDDGLAIDDFSITPLSEAPEVSFDIAADTVVEGGSYVVSLHLSRPAFQADSLHIDISPGDAIRGIDFSTIPFTNTSIALPVNIGDSVLTFTVVTTDDMEDEATEQITFTIVPDEYFEIGNQNTFILGIDDNDLATVHFEISADSLYEDETRALRVLLSSPLATNVSVTLRVNESHGLHYGHHQDYTTSPSLKQNGRITLTIPAGSTEAIMEFHANDDRCEEGDETATFTIMEVSAGTIGFPASLVVTIKDLEPCRPVFVLHPNPTPGPVNIWTLAPNRDKVIEGSLVDSDGNVLAAATGTVHELGDAFTEVMRCRSRGVYYVRLTMCGHPVSLRLYRY